MHIALAAARIGNLRNNDNSVLGSVPRSVLGIGATAWVTTVGNGAGDAMPKHRTPPNRVLSGAARIVFGAPAKRQSATYAVTFSIAALSAVSLVRQLVTLVSDGGT